MEYTQIKETCLYVESLEKIREFYSNVLSMPVISYKEGRHVFFRVGSSVLLCFIAEVTKAEKNLPPHFGNGNQHIAFEVPASTYQDAKATLTEKGVQITHEQEWPHSRYSFYFNDPEGNVLEIVVPGIWEGN